MKNLADNIVKWLKNYTISHQRKSLVIGVSGGVDSGLVSTLCAMTGIPTYCIILPCQSRPKHSITARKHIKWLQSKFSHVYFHEMDLTNIFEMFESKTRRVFDRWIMNDDLAYANAKSRLRMITLYYVATINNGLVVGTGNKVEDFGIGFFTKYGDGGVDISPIADLTKTEVRTMAKVLGVDDNIVTATPTDGLWTDGRTDEQSIGATYEELEWAMDFCEKTPESGYLQENMDVLTDRQKEVLRIYQKRHAVSFHKLTPIPTFKR